jgi:hypothetical protein
MFFSLGPGGKSAPDHTEARAGLPSAEFQGRSVGRLDAVARSIKDFECAQPDPNAVAMRETSPVTPAIGAAPMAVGLEFPGGASSTVHAATVTQLPPIEIAGGLRFLAVARDPVLRVHHAVAMRLTMMARCLAAPMHVGAVVTHIVLGERRAHRQRRDNERKGDRELFDHFKTPWEPAASIVPLRSPNTKS